MKMLFLDESGDHSLSKIDPLYPLFVLGGIIVDHDYAKGELERRILSFKQQMFGRTDIILHTADITRNRNGFERMKDSGFRTVFYAELNLLMRELEYQVVACVIRKDHHLDKYDTSALDPYFLSLQILIERFCFEVGPVPEGGHIIAEKRGHPLDNQIELAWLNLKVQGTRFMQATQIAHRISGLALRGKNAGIGALELADLVVTPIGRFVQGKPIREDFRIIETKFRRDASGNYLGPGLVVLPRQ